MPKLTILADDFTGALDTAAKLAGCRIPCFVTSDREITISDLPPDCEVLTIDTESRHIPPKEAYLLYRNLCRKWEGCSPCIYIKTDSVLRGNLSASLAGAADALKCPAAFVPAFPSMGRVTKGGKHFVGGLPLEQSAFAADPLNPTVTSDICQILSRDYPVSAKIIPEGAEIPKMPSRESRQVLLFDCSSDEEIVRISEKLKTAGLLRLTAGCAGFAARFPKLLHFKISESQRIGSGGVFLLSGSANSITWEQLDFGESIGWKVFSPKWTEILDGNPEPALCSLESAFRSGDCTALAVSRNRQQAEGFTEFAASRGMDGRQLHDAIQRYIQKLVPAVTERLPVRNLAVFGGDTLFSAMEALQCRSLQVQGEIEDGVPFSSVHIHGKDFTIISKSGGLGSIKVLDTLLASCTLDNQQERI